MAILQVPSGIDAESVRPYEHAVARLAIEIALTLNGSIILPSAIFQFDANPFSLGKMRGACVLDQGWPFQVEDSGPR